MARVASSSRTASSGRTASSSRTAASGRVAVDFEDFATLPQLTVDSSLASTTTTLDGASSTLTSVDNFQTALNNANPGDTINLTAGDTWTGNFTLPVKTNPSNKYIWIKSSSAGIPAEGTRAVPSHATSMPKLKSSNATAVITLDEGGGYYRFTGIDFSFTTTTGSGRQRIISIGQGAGTMLTPAEVPTNIIIDRCLVHMDGTNDDVVRGVMLNAKNSAVVDSSIWDIRHRGADSQAINFWNTPGPLKIENNYLEATGENLMSGGADPAAADMIPSDVTIKRNHLKKLLSWKENDASYAGINWAVKNILELKVGKRFLIEANVLENCWADAQAGFIFSFKVTNQDGNSGPFATTEDITVRYNLGRHAGIGAAFTARDVDATVAEHVLNRVLFENNLLYDLGTHWNNGIASTNGNAMTINVGPTAASGSDTARQIPNNLTIRRNTVLNSNSGIAVVFGDLPTTPTGMNLRFSDNIIYSNASGIKGSDASTGTDTLATQYADMVADRFKGNLIIGGTSSNYTALLSTSPATAFPANDAAVGWDDLAGVTDANYSGYALDATSTFKNAGTDGIDPGADIATIISMTAGVIGGLDFVSDTLIGTGSLLSHVGEIGATWTRHPAAAYATANFTLGSSGIWQDGTIAEYASGIPADADYSVFADFKVLTVISTNVGICLRMSTSADTMYSLRLNNGVTWEVRRINAGTSATIASSTTNVPTAGGAARTMELRIAGENIRVFNNGVEDTALAIADSQISAAGRVGVRGAGASTSTTGTHISNLRAAE